MSFDWEEYLTLAQHLFNQSSNPSFEEALMRTVTSRAYYSAYHYALQAAKVIGFKPELWFRNELHQRLVEYYKEGNNKEIKEIGIKLERLLLDRKEADYESITKTAVRFTASTSLREAKKVIEWSKPIIERS